MADEEMAQDIFRGLQIQGNDANKRPDERFRFGFSCPNRESLPTMHRVAQLYHAVFPTHVVSQRVCTCLIRLSACAHTDEYNFEIDTRPPWLFPIPTKVNDMTKKETETTDANPS